jgi:hypothetical protein
MKIPRTTLLCLCILLALAACTAPPEATAIPPTATFAIPKNDSEIVPPEETAAANRHNPGSSAAGADGLRIYQTPVFETRGTWNRRLINAAVFYYSSNFYMAYAAADDWRSSFQVGAASSHDGFTWEQTSPEPRLSPEDVPGGAYSLFASSILIGNDSGRVAQWDLYYSTNETNAQFPRGAIGRAIAVDPIAPWIPDETMALNPGESGEWDDRSLAHPEVLKTSAGYLMYYSGYNRDGGSAIGMATSPDGTTWRKYDDPDTTDAAYIHSDPILSADTPGWGEINPRNVRVLQLSQNDWRMAYLGLTDERGSFVGFATSTDGIHWVPVEEIPVITADDIPDGVTIANIDLVASEDTFYVFIVCIRSDDTSAVYVATMPR